jgi:Cu/Ag efflux protein CusF
MPARMNGLIVASLLLTGCAGYELAPLAANHPAHPEAPVAPEPAPSQTLAYSRADIPSVQPVSPVTAVPHEGHGSRPTEAGSSPTVVGEGEVIATVPNASQIVVEHGEIKGFMEAMTMGYRVDPASLLAGLKQGDKVRFTIDVQRRAIIGIEKLQ